MDVDIKDTHIPDGKILGLMASQIMGEAVSMIITAVADQL